MQTAPAEGAMANTPQRRGQESPPVIPNANCPQDWRINREGRFTWRQQRAHDWISFREIAEWLSELDGHGVPNEAARVNAYDLLMRDLLAGDFEEQGRSKVRYLHFRTAMARMTRERLNNALDTLSLADVRSEYLARCWIPRRMFDRWLAKHELPQSPARFEPQSPAENTRLHPDQSLRLTRPPSMRRRGREPRKLKQVVEAMRRDIQAGQMTVARLEAAREKELASTYEVSRDTVRKARNIVLSRNVENSISTNDK
jgi:hypothetical protein